MTSKLAPLLQAGTLAGITALATLLLSWSSAATAPRIEQEKRKDLERMLAQVIDAKLHDNALLEHVVEVPSGSGHRYYVATQGQPPKVVAFAFQTTSEGYSGPIAILTGLKPDGTILGVRITAHTETPGLGDRIEAEKSDWITQFTGKSLVDPPLERWAVNKDGGDFDALTGATITPRAVVKGVREGLVSFDAVKAQLASAADDVASTRIKQDGE